MSYTSDNKYLLELARQFPTREAVCGEIIRLNAILNLPKGTEHFLSDLHGEWEAFSHIRRNASGVIRHKINLLFGEKIDENEQTELASLIYYPDEKLEEAREKAKNTPEWYRENISRLLEICRLVGSKYTRAIVREHLSEKAGEFAYIIEELIADGDDEKKAVYCESIIKTSIRIGAADDVIIALASAIKSLVIDHLHIVGDIFDRGPRADLILDELMKERSIDVQWGNHDVLWMGAAAGSRLCIATVLNNSITYKNLDVIEIGYGISLRPLALFAEEVYAGSDISAFLPKGESGGNFFGGGDDSLVARMHKAISVIQFKLEGQAIKRNPSFDMKSRLLLERVDKNSGKLILDGKEYKLRDKDFPTLLSDPYELTEQEREVMAYLKVAFMRSEKLSRQVRFLYEKGTMYTVYNNNLLYHGCIPMTDEGEFQTLGAAGGRKGKELMDYCDKMARSGFFSKEGSAERQAGKDFLWFLWCGKDSPLCARKKIATFERLLIDDKESWVEPKNAYYKSWDSKEIAVKILAEFGLPPIGSHIINGHIPVNKGENPIKAGGKIVVIDGGFCKAYHGATGIGGYTLIYNAEGLRLLAHEPFTSKAEAIKNNADIISSTTIFESKADRLRIRETDAGDRIREKIADLMLLMKEYESGNVK
ncbi:MAG: fructose-1,6-bisphosphatase [Ruminococcaceae bacterium]|nr:fructose-1,6-bisphosphatase [Oscillospiraceae bacterium]